MTSLFTASAAGTFTGAGFQFPCATGKAGVVDAIRKSEGDGASPIGTWRLERLYWRPDRLARPSTGLPATPLRPHDGWCDAAGDPLYNRPVTLPYPASHERLWREDHVYDLIVELDHNADPVVQGRGSAIFFHLARPDYAPTEGCVALALDDMLQVLALCDRDSRLEITP